MSIITRFAPSPTGNLHIGSARTALFNWLYSKNCKGKFLLRIEDTDKKRSSDKFLESILQGLSWLGLNYDGEIIFQSKRTDRHIEIVKRLLSLEKAYYCYCPTAESIDFSKQQVSKKNCPCKFHKNRTLKNQNEAVVKFEITDNENVTFVDNVYGQISVSANQIEDIIILRSDNTPTYNLAVVVDDHDMEITDIIRGNDHISNTSKQLLLYKSLNWDIPNFTHIPLIHDSSGNKLSKRRNAVSVDEYYKAGILPEAMFNYLLRMGWSHGNDEIIEMAQAKQWFSIKNIGLSPAKLDDKKLEYLNNYYINKKENVELCKILLPIIENKLGYNITNTSYLLKGLSALKKGALNLIQLAESSLFYVEKLPITIDKEAYTELSINANLIKMICESLESIDLNDWTKNTLLTHLREIAKAANIKIQNIYPIIRAAITGRIHSPSILEIMEILEKNECLKRLKRPYLKFAN